MMNTLRSGLLRLGRQQQQQQLRQARHPSSPSTLLQQQQQRQQLRGQGQQRRLFSDINNRAELELKGTADNAFNRERAAAKRHAAATSDLWRKLSIYVVIPCIILASINAWNLWDEHWEHWSHLPPLEERVEYPYQNVRTKNFPWGDGDKTLFWNDKVNYHRKDKAS